MLCHDSAKNQKQDGTCARIAELSYQYRTLGLGYANLGALLMASGLGYDSVRGRAIAGAVSAPHSARPSALS